MMRAWSAYKATPEYANSRSWAKHSEHVDGSLWASFMTGWEACGGEQLRAELAASREREARMQWQPIDTAPKDGRKVILFYRNSHNRPRTVMARWLTDEQAAETDADGVGLEGGWYECIDNWNDYTEVAIHEGEPTHWMPLPPPPSAALAEGAQG